MIKVVLVMELCVQYQWSVVLILAVFMSSLANKVTKLWFSKVKE